MKPVSRTTTIGLACAAVIALGAASASAATSVDRVHPGDLGPAEDWHTADTRPGGTLELSAEYGGALGAGAAVLGTSTSGAKVQLLTDAHDGTYLRDVTAIEYATYVAEAPGASPAAPALNIRLDRDDDGFVDAYLVYEPYQDDAFYGNDTMLRGTWQTWDAWHDRRSEWWSGQIPECQQATPCTIEALLALHPTASIQADPVSLRSGSTPADADFHGSFGINQGSGNPGVRGAADALRIATATGVDVTYDFEPAVVLAGRQDCKKGGWATSTAPEFGNQGACVSFFAAPGRAGGR